MLEATTVKIVWNTLIVFIGGVLAYLGISQDSFLMLSLLLVIDYATGLIKARRLQVSITSNKMKYGLISKLSLLLIPLVLAIGAKAIGADFTLVLLSGINILVLSEVYSIIGNVYSIRTKLELPEYDAVSMLGKRIRDILIRKSEGEKSDRKSEGEEINA